MDCVAALGIDAANSRRTWTASGFLYGHFEATKDAGQKEYRIFLITNRHVVQDQHRFYLRFNPQGTSAAKEYHLDLTDSNGQPGYGLNSDPKVDIATIPINFSKLQEDGIEAKFFANDAHTVPIPAMNETGVTEGDFVYQTIQAHLKASNTAESPPPTTEAPV
jgi:hypothetical protein